MWCVTIKYDNRMGINVTYDISFIVCNKVLHVYIYVSLI